MSVLATLGIIFTILGGMIPLLGALLWLLRRWIRVEVVSCLRNDDTPVAVYAHQARDAAEHAGNKAEHAGKVAEHAVERVEAVWDTLQELHQDLRGMNGALIQHITNTDIHRGK